MRPPLRVGGSCEPGYHRNFRCAKASTHLVEIWHLGNVAKVDYGEVPDPLRNAVQCLVHLHARWVVVVAEPDNDDAILLGENSLVHVPTGGQMRQEVGHDTSNSMEERSRCRNVLRNYTIK